MSRKSKGTPGTLGTASPARVADAASADVLDLVLRLIADSGGAATGLNEGATRSLDNALAGLDGEPLADALWSTVLFAGFCEGEDGGAIITEQLLAVVDRHAQRMPAPTAVDALHAGREAAAKLGNRAPLIPVGTVPPPEGSVKGLGARMMANKR